MRRHGSETRYAGLGCQDHGCLLYDDDAEYLEAGVAFLRDGLEAGERLMYAGSAPVAELHRHVAPLGDVEAMLADGRLQLVSTGETYALEALDPVGQAEVYDSAIDAALADGFTGLRTLAEMTPVLLEPRNRDALVAWEARADRMMAARPWSALCCYDRRRLDGGVLAGVAAVHPVACGDPDLTPFRVFNAAPGRMAVAGTVDAFACEDFTRVLDLAAPENDFVLDLAPLEFVDHSGVLAISERARRNGLRPRMTVEGWPFTATRIADVMGVTL